jgi:hypothetical protein
VDGYIIEDLVVQSSEVILRQVLATVVVLIVAWLLQLLLSRSLDNADDRFVQMPLVQKFLRVMQRILWPMLALILSQLVSALFTDLAWTSFFIELWLLYGFFVALLAVNLPPEQARVWSRKVLLPIVLVVALLQSLGLLDDVLQWTFTPRRDIKITIGSILAGLAVLAIFFVLARLVKQYLERIFLPQINVGRALTSALAILAS